MRGDLGGLESKKVPEVEKLKIKTPRICTIFDLTEKD